MHIGLATYHKSRWDGSSGNDLRRTSTVGSGSAHATITLTLRTAGSVDYNCDLLATVVGARIPAALGGVVIAHLFILGTGADRLSILNLANLFTGRGGTRVGDSAGSSIITQHIARVTAAGGLANIRVLDEAVLLASSIARGIAYLTGALGHNQLELLGDRGTHPAAVGSDLHENGARSSICRRWCAGEDARVWFQDESGSRREAHGVISNLDVLVRCKVGLEIQLKPFTFPCILCGDSKGIDGASLAEVATRTSTP